tara:strand:+ start:75 stop:806 length:732 start_codon:yes stop_codon:yes gene_type:complete
MSENIDNGQDAPKASKMRFGVTSETKTSNNTPILVASKIENDPQFPNGWKFPICRLVNVACNPSFEKKNLDKVAIIDFIFKDADGRQHIHREWEVDENDSAADKKMDGLNIRVAHIYSAVFGSVPQGGIGSDATSFADFYTKVALAFNSELIVEGDKQIKKYSRVNLFIKLTYYKANFGFPLSPNFLEKVVQGRPCTTLAINTTYDKLQAATASSGVPGMGAMPGMGAGASSDDLPDFDNSFS